MEATELMIGDWVTSIKSTRVVGMRQHGVFVDGQTSNYPIDVEPIPLTEKMLMANGFERNVLCADGYYFAPAPDMHDVMFHVSEDYYEDVWHIETFVDHNDNAYALFNVCYVHEMQHILRLCGLTDLADNFKLA